MRGTRHKTRTQSALAFWSAGEGSESNGHHFPRKHGVPVLVCMLKITTEITDCLVMAGRKSTLNVLEKDFFKSCSP